MQRQCYLCFQCQRGMAAGKHQFEPLIRNRCIFHLGCSSLFFLLDQFLQKYLFASQGSGAAQAVNGLAPRRGGNPGTRITWDAIYGPAFQGDKHGILQRILGQLEVPHGTDKSGENAICFLRECLYYSLVRSVHASVPRAGTESPPLRWFPRATTRVPRPYNDTNYSNSMIGRISIDPSMAAGIFVA